MSYNWRKLSLFMPKLFVTQQSRATVKEEVSGFYPDTTLNNINNNALN
jgi:hypothetical protein